MMSIPNLVTIPEIGENIKISLYPESSFSDIVENYLLY
jgi:hypothetical protein